MDCLTKGWECDVLKSPEDFCCWQSVGRLWVGQVVTSLERSQKSPKLIFSDEIWGVFCECTRAGSMISLTSLLAVHIRQLFVPVVTSADGCLLQWGLSNYIPWYLWDVITCPCPWYICFSNSIGIKVGSHYNIVNQGDRSSLEVKPSIS